MKVRTSTYISVSVYTYVCSYVLSGTCLGSETKVVAYRSVVCDSGRCSGCTYQLYVLVVGEINIKLFHVLVYRH